MKGIYYSRKAIRVLLLILLIYPYSYILDAQEKKQDKNFTIAPYFNYSSTVGVGLGLVPIYSFRIGHRDSISPKSVVGAVGYYTTNKSSAFLTFGNLFLHQDDWRIQYGIGFSNYNFQTYFEPPVGEGLFLDYGTRGFFAVASIRRRVYRKWYAGLGYTYRKLSTDFGFSLPSDTTQLHILTLETFHDVRDYIYYPKSGSQFILKLNYVPQWLGNDVPGTNLIANYNAYFSTRGGRDVIALRAHTKAGIDSIAFQQQPVLGGVDLRGYSEGKYRGDGLMDIQAEYRWNFPNRFHLGLVGFAGMGTIYGSSVPDFDWKAYPSIGAGIRYTALQKDHINVGLDFGLGKDDWGVYFRFREAF